MNPYPSDYTPTGDGAGGKFSPADILFKYLAYLPLFLVCLAASVGGGLLYLRYTTPKYLSSVQMLVKSGERNPVYGGQGDIVERALYGPRDINMSNEIQKLRSVEVVRRAVVKNNFHIQYFNEGNIKTSNLYDKVPYRLVPVLITDSSRAYRFRFTDLSPKGYTLLVGAEGREPHQWNDEISLYGSRFKLVPKNDPSNMLTTDAVNIATWANPTARANEILGRLNIYVADPNTTILTFSILNDNPELGRAILDALVQEYILYSVETKNVAAEATIAFIEQRLDSLSREIRQIEQSSRDFADKNDVFTPEQQNSIYSTKIQQGEETLAQIAFELDMLQRIETYMRVPRRQRTELVPSPMGVKDPQISALLSTFNSLRLQRQATAEQSPETGLLVTELDRQLDEVQANLAEAMRLYRTNLQTQRTDIAQKTKTYLGYLALLPEKERRFLEIERLKKVKEGLYTYLLQRKEEIAITTASTDPGYEALNAAGGSPKPIEPDASSIRLFSILLGLLVPIGIIYLRDLLNDRVMTRDDIQKKTTVNIIGEVGHVEDSKSLVVADKSRNIVSEQFRIVRSNLAFLMNQRPFQTILVTSTVSGEGKSFISINLAAVLALAGKKVALLEFDLRRPRIMRSLELKKTGVGISNVLLGLVPPEEVYTPLPNFPELHVYPSGIVPPNPGELVLSQGTRNFFTYLKSQYDYVIIDSAPVGLVSDTFSLAPYIDTSIFIVRHRFTYKRQISFVEEVYQSGKLPHLWLVVNDLKMGARFGYYGYGYGYGKGYGYGYGHYYGYGGGYFSQGADEYYDVKVPAWRRFLKRWRKKLRK